MQNFVRFTFLSFFALFLGACSAYQSNKEVEALNEAKAVGSPFTQQLAAEYRDFANSEKNVMFDYADSLHFARKGLAAAAGEVVLPEPVTDWNLKPDQSAELSAARARLMKTFMMGARESLPKEAAMAQGRYDCWIEQQEENWQKKDISKCKAGFEEVVTIIEQKLSEIAPRSVEPPVSGPPDESGPLAAQDAVYLVFFDFNKFNINAGGENVLDAVSDEIKTRAALKAVNVTGHADRSGSRSYNQRLSLKRANAVRQELIAQGVDAALIAVDARGEDEPMVPTGDNVREPANRRTTITFQE